MTQTTIEEFKQLVEQQGRALMDVMQSVALGNLDVEIEVPEGIEMFSDLAIGLGIMVDDIREAMAEQERAGREAEEARQRLTEALEEAQNVQRRYFQRSWGDYASIPEASLGHLHSEDKDEETAEAWLPAMTSSVEQVDAVVEGDEQGGSTLAVPITLYDEVIGVLGFSRQEAEQWSEGERAVVQAVAEQVALTLEDQRLFNEAQRATFLMGERVKALDCLNDIGRRMEEAPIVADFLRWVAERIPAAMRYSEVCLATVEFEGQIYGMAEAMNLPCQVVQALRVGGETLGRIYVAYTEGHDFLDEESALLGDIARRVSRHIENQRLLRETQTHARELAVLNEMSRELAARLDVTVMLENLYRHTSRLMEVTSFYVALYDPDTDMVSFPLAIESGERVDWQPRQAGKGLTEYVIRSHEPLLIKENVAARVRELTGVEPIGRDAESWLGVPMMIGGRVIGVITAQSYVTPQLYDERQRDLLSAIASQAAIVIDNARLLAQTRAALDETESLYQASAELNLAQGYDNVLAVLRKHTVLGQEAQSIGLGLFDCPWMGHQVPAWINMLAVWSESLPAAIAERYSLSAFPSIDQILRPDVPTLIEDVDNDPIMDDEFRALFEQLDAKSVIFVPLVVGGQWIGYINAVYQQTVGFPESELRRLMAMAGQAAVVVQNLYQLHQIQARALREQILREVTTHMRSSTDPDVILRIAVRELGTALGRPTFVRLGTVEELSGAPVAPRGGGKGKGVLREGGE